MKRITCMVLCLVGLSLCVYAEAPSPGDLSAIALTHMGLNAEPQEAGPPYAAPLPNVDNISWVAEPDCPNTINRSACGKIGNYVYIFGGQGSGGSLTHLAFNLVTQQWEYSTTPTLGGSNWSSAVANGSMYLFPRSGITAEVSKFTPTGAGPTGEWSLVNFYPEVASANAVGWDGANYIYCAGGSVSSGMTANAYRLNLTTYQYDTLPPMPEARGYVGGAFCSGKFYVLGGDNNSYQYTNTCYEFNPSTMAWSTKAPLIKASAFNCFNTVTDGQKIYLVGGGGGNASSLPSTDTVQVYDPATNQWSLETNRMNNYGTNSAAYVPEDNYILDVGGRIMTTSYNCTWRGNLTTTPPPQLDVTMTFLGYGMGLINFRCSVVNNGPSQNPFTVWARIKNPDGSYTPPTLGPVQINPPIGVTVTRDRTQLIAPTWPPGLYTYIGYAGWTMLNPVDADSFTFTISGEGQGPFDPAPYSGGELFPGEQPQTAFIPSGLDLGVFPNPFNPTTALSYKLQAASQVSLRVYDTAGRLVSTLADGMQEAGQHSVTFDGSKLTSGIYFVRLQAGSFTAVQKLMLLR